MPDVTLSFTNAEAQRIITAQEADGFEGTNAEHLAEFKRRHIRFEKQFVKEKEEAALRELNAPPDLEIT